MAQGAFAEPAGRAEVGGLHAQASVPFEDRVSMLDTYRPVAIEAYVPRVTAHSGRKSGR